MPEVKPVRTESSLTEDSSSIAGWAGDTDRRFSGAGAHGHAQEKTSESLSS